MLLTHLGKRVGTQAMLVNAVVDGELILASSISPPDLERGPTELTYQQKNICHHLKVTDM